MASPAAAAPEPAACSASALGLSLLGGAPIVPIQANSGSSTCQDATGQLLNLPLLVAKVDAVEATTRVTATKQAVANARIAGVRLGTSGLIDSLTGPLLSGPNSIVGQVDGAVSGLLGPSSALGQALSPLLVNVLGLGGLTSGGPDQPGLLTSITSSLPGALSAALPDVLSADVIQATASSVCTNGAGQLSGSSQIAGLKVLGLDVDANGAANQLLSLDTANLNLGKLLTVDDILKNIKITATGPLGAILSGVIGSSNTNVYALLHATDSGLVGALNTLIGTVTGGQTLGTILSGVTNALQPVLDSIQINLPSGLLNAKVSPNVQEQKNGQLTQFALLVSVSALSQPVLAASLANAQVSTGSAGCTPPAAAAPTAPKPADKYPSPEAAAILQCSKNPITLIDVTADGRRALVTGVAETRLVGKTVSIYQQYGHSKVGTAKVRSNGTFRAHVAKPPLRIRTTNRARYYAVADGARTQALKYARRMEVTRIRASLGRVAFVGRVVSPRFGRQPTVLVRIRKSCTSYETVARVKPNAQGRFRALVSAPKGAQAAVYRAQTFVPSVRGSKKRQPTYTLPRVVGLS